MKKCSIEGCTRIYKCRGLCRTHYSRWQIHGDPNINLRKQPGKCIIEDCKSLPVARGWCEKHYSRYRANGDPLIIKTRIKGKCRLDDCNKKHFAKGYCQTHYNRNKKYNNPLVTLHRTKCAIIGCDKKHTSKGYCNNHYMLWSRYNKPEAFDGKVKDRKPKFELILEECLIKYSKDECWLWEGAKNKWGYGIVAYRDKKSALVHRESYNYFIGQINDKLLACHHCDNPACFNPWHIFLGTNLDNSNDMISKGRASWQKRRNKNETRL